MPRHKPDELSVKQLKDWAGTFIIIDFPIWDHVQNILLQDVVGEPADITLCSTSLRRLPAGLLQQLPPGWQLQG